MSQVDATDDADQILVAVLVERIQIVSDGPREEHRLLRNDSLNDNIDVRVERKSEKEHGKRQPRHQEIAWKRKSPRGYREFSEKESEANTNTAGKRLHAIATYRQRGEKS